MTLADATPTGLIDRREEREALGRLLESIRVGQSAVLVLRGDAGIGKTALLEHVAEAAGGCRIARAVGVQSEMELAFAGLHQLCAPMLDGMGSLPEPQQQALRVAFGMEEGGAPNPFLVALAALGLLAEAAEAQPLVCLFDDAQWLDRASAQVLSFVARRLLAERIAMVFAVREPSAADHLAGLPELRVEGLASEDARELLQAVVPGRVDTRVRDRILAETRGNPLALIELPRGLSPAQLAGGFGLPDARPLTSRIEHRFRDRVEALPEDCRRLLLMASAEPLGDANLLWRAAEGLGIGAGAAAPAEGAGLIEFGARVRFTHPLVRSAVYRAAEPAARRAAHAARAEATDPDVDPDRRAWHRAHATAGPDAAVAAEMVRSADRAQRRSGRSAAAAFLQRAAELTPDGGLRVDRALDAAQAKLDVADAASAADLLAAAAVGPVDALQRARLERLGAQIAFARSRGRDAPPLLLEAAQRLAPLDPGLARETFLEAMASAMFAGRLGAGPDERAIAEAVRAAGLGGGSASAGTTANLLDALVTRFTAGYAASVAPLQEALRAFLEEKGEDQRWMWLACRLAQELWDDELWHALAARGVEVARETGALNLLPAVENHLSAWHVHAGDLVTAAALADEVDAITEATGLPPLKFSRGMLAAVRGAQAEVQALFAFAARNTIERGEGSALASLHWLAALVANGEGRYAEALTAAQESCAREDVMIYGRALIELVEAATRCGEAEAARDALERLTPRTQAAGTAWALGAEARCRALAEDDEAAYVRAIELLSQSGARFELARARLLYGEWLRRANRRADAREHLRTAHADLSRFGALAFAERAHRELLATGETVRRRSEPDTRDALTPQEIQVARLARDGHTNPEIGAQLFISPRTVEYHLRTVFRKLGVTTRHDLAEALAAEAN
jgi:DNA-binding CsgD family transcriptional regulator